MTKRTQLGFTLIELMIVVAIIGVLASIASSNYQQYTARAQVSEAMNLLGGLKTGMQESYSQTGNWALPAGSNSTGKYVNNIDDSTSMILTLHFKPNNISPLIASQTITWTYSNVTNTWSCSSSLQDSVRPKTC